MNIFKRIINHIWSYFKFSSLATLPIDFHWETYPVIFNHKLFELFKPFWNLKYNNTLNNIDNPYTLCIDIFGMFKQSSFQNLSRNVQDVILYHLTQHTNWVIVCSDEFKMLSYNDKRYYLYRISGYIINHFYPYRNSQFTIDDIYKEDQMSLQYIKEKMKIDNIFWNNIRLSFMQSSRTLQEANLKLQNQRLLTKLEKLD
jgi:hypothetical protein